MTARVVRVETAGGHRYELSDGTDVPGVTTIIGKAVPKPALVPWAANTAAAYAVNHWDELGGLPVADRLERIKKEWRGVRDRAADRGTRVHAYGEAVIAGQDVDVPAELMPYVEPYAAWLDEWQVRPVAVEQVVYSDSPSYAGTLDLVADLGDGSRWLLDLKTTGSGVWPETSLQLAAYRWADRMGDVPMVDVDRAGVVWLPGDGTCQLVPVQTGPQVFEAFRAACEVRRWAVMRKGDLIGRPLSPPVRVVGQEQLAMTTGGTG